MAIHIQLRRGAAVSWTAINPVLAEGELGVELDTGKFKLGNGISNWNTLLYSSGPKGDTPDLVSPAAIGTGTPNTGTFTILTATGHTTFEGVTSTGATGTGNIVYSISPTLTTPVLGVVTSADFRTGTFNWPTNISSNAATVTNGVYTTGAYTDPTWLTITKSKVGLSNVDNESKATMFASPTFSGIPLAPTADATTNTTQIATTQFVKTAVGNLINSAPTALDTLNELATALGNDANFATTITNSLALKAPLANPTFTGTVGGITKSMVGLSNVDNTADATKNVLYATTAGSASASDVYAWAKAATKPSYTASEIGLGNVTNESKATMFTSPTFTGGVTISGALQLNTTGQNQIATNQTSGTLNIGSGLGSSIITIGKTAIGSMINLQSPYVEMGGDALVEGNLEILGTLTAQSNLQLTGLNTANQNIATAQTTGSLTIGGTTASGTITLGQSSLAQTVDINSADVLAGSGTKVTNIGNNNAPSTVSDSATTINIGRSNYGGTTVNIGSTSSNNTNIAIVNIATGPAKNISIGTGTNSVTGGTITIGSYATTVNSVEYFGTTTFIRGNINLDARTQNVSISPVQTSGTVTIGGGSGTGDIRIGSSSLDQTVNIATGPTASTKTKTINIGSGGVTNSTTNISIGKSNGNNNIQIGAAALTASLGYNQTDSINIGPATWAASGGASFINIGTVAHPSNGSSNIKIGTVNYQTFSYLEIAGFIKINAVVDSALELTTSINEYKPFDQNSQHHLNIGSGFHTNGAASHATSIQGNFEHYNGEFTVVGGDSTTGNITIGYEDLITTGIINIGGTTQTGAINIGRSTSPQTVNIGTGINSTVNIGSSTQATTLNGIVTATGSLTVSGNLTVNGTTTTLNSTTLTVDDKNIELGSIASPTNTTADGGGITLKGTTDKILNWVNATSAWTSSEDFNLLTGKVYKINGTSVLSASTLGSGVTGSSLTSVGTIGTGVWQATIVGPTYGGTGVNNGSKTITLGGNLTTSGAFATTLIATAATSITLPTTGTLATLAGTENLSNKTLDLCDIDGGTY
jgi:hypothetical protein